MDTSTPPAEQRKNKRFQLDEQSYALLRQPLYSELGQIVDLSRSGISFLCLNEGGWSDQPFEIDIFTGNDPEQPLREEGCLKSLPLEPISYAAEPREFGRGRGTTLIRCGGQFGPLSAEQEAGIELLLRRQATPLPPPGLKHGSDD